MKTIYLLIEECQHCPYIRKGKDCDGYSVTRCAKTGERIIAYVLPNEMGDNLVPEWCELEEYKK